MVKMHLPLGTMQNLNTRVRNFSAENIPKRFGMCFRTRRPTRELRLHQIKEQKVINMLRLERKWKN